MRRIKIFIDNTIIPADIYAGQKIAFIFLPAGRQTAQGREQVVHQASVDNENGRVINVTWQAKGWFNRLRSTSKPISRKKEEPIPTTCRPLPDVGNDFVRRNGMSFPAA